MTFKCPLCGDHCSKYYDKQWIYFHCINPHCMMGETSRFECQFHKDNVSTITYYDLFDFENGIYYSLTYNVAFFDEKRRYMVRVYEEGGNGYLIEEYVPYTVEPHDAPKVLEKYKMRFKKILAFL